MPLGPVLRSVLGSALSPALGEGVGDFTPLTLFAGGRGGAWWENDKSYFAQNADGSGAVTAPGDEVRYIADLSGNDNHLTILTTGTPGIYREANGHGYVDCSTNGCSFKTANNKTLQLPRYLAWAGRKTVMEDNPLFGIIRSTSDLFAIRGHTEINRAKSYLRSTALGIADPLSNAEYGPLNALSVEDALAVVGTVDISANGLPRASEANSWLADTVASTNAVYGINMGSSTATSNTNQDFYGGIIVEGEVSDTDRANVLRYLRSRIDRPVDATDINILVLGDSTGDKVPAGAADPAEWVWRFGAEKLAADDATAFVGIRTYDATAEAYGPEIIIQQGTGGPTYRIYNGSVAGSSPSQFVGTRYGPAIEQVPEPAAIWWNFGHNMTGSPVTASYTVLMDPVRATWPGATHLAIRQNPWRDTNSMAGIIAAFDTVVSSYGDIIVADVYAHYISNSKPADWYADTVHPSRPTGVDEWMPLIEAAWDLI